MTYLVDTNACIALINGAPKAVRRRFRRAVANEATVLVSSVVAFELWYGVAKSQRKEANTQRLDAFLAGPLTWTLFDEDDARELGGVPPKAEASRTRIVTTNRVGWIVLAPGSPATTLSACSSSSASTLTSFPGR